MNYTVEMASNGTIYVQSSMKIGFGIQIVQYNSIKVIT